MLLNKRSGYLKLFGRFVDFHCTIAALLVPFKCFEHAGLRKRIMNRQIDDGVWYMDNHNTTTKRKITASEPYLSTYINF